MEDFVAIDFETANQYRTSVCSVGIVVVRNGIIVDKYYSPIHPEPNFYTYFTTQVHGLTEKDTNNAPSFPQVWQEISKKIDNLPLLAHNSPFDEGCLKAVFKLHNMPYPTISSTAPAKHQEEHLKTFLTTNSTLLPNNAVST